MSAGVPFGAPTPYHWLASKPGRKSPTVGTSGNASERVAVVTASGRSLPPLMYSIAAGTVLNTSCTWPPSRSASAGPNPRYGTSSMSVPVCILKYSLDAWSGPPAPPDPTLTLRGLALA